MDASGGDMLEALGWVRGAHACLALAIGLAGWLNALQLWWYLRRADVYTVQPGWARFLRQLLVAALGMVAAVLAMLWLWQDWTTWPCGSASGGCWWWSVPARWPTRRCCGCKASARAICGIEGKPERRATILQR